MVANGDLIEGAVSGEALWYPHLDPPHFDRMSNI